MPKPEESVQTRVAYAIVGVFYAAFYLLALLAAVGVVVGLIK